MAVRLGGMMLGILVVTHWTACVWFALALAYSFNEDTWAGKKWANFEESSLYSQYITSLYWVISCVHDVPNEVEPVSSLEYTFGTFVAVLCFVCTVHFKFNS